FTQTVPTTTYTLSLHDALPISPGRAHGVRMRCASRRTGACPYPCMKAHVQIGGICQALPGSYLPHPPPRSHARLPPSPFNGEGRSEEHTSELQSRERLVCRLLL